MLTFKQVLWAARHDWFISDNGDGTIVVLGDNGRLTWKGNFVSLREWAGY